MGKIIEMLRRTFFHLVLNQLKSGEGKNIVKNIYTITIYIKHNMDEIFRVQAIKSVHRNRAYAPNVTTARHISVPKQ